MPPRKRARAQDTAPTPLDVRVDALILKVARQQWSTWPIRQLRNESVHDAGAEAIVNALSAAFQSPDVQERARAAAALQQILQQMGARRVVSSDASALIENLADVTAGKAMLLAAGVNANLMKLVVAGIGSSSGSINNTTAGHAAGALANLLRGRVDPAAAAAEYTVEDIEALIELLDLVRADPGSTTAASAATTLVNLLNSGNTLVEYNIMDSFDLNKHGPNWVPPSLADMETCAPLQPLLAAMKTKAHDWRDEAERFGDLFGLRPDQSAEKHKQYLRRAMTLLDEWSEKMPEEAYILIGEALIGRRRAGA
jgi:hypothetical protein